jgi:hypothetical protein
MQGGGNIKPGLISSGHSMVISVPSRIIYSRTSRTTQNPLPWLVRK